MHISYKFDFFASWLPFYFLFYPFKLMSSDNGTIYVQVGQCSLLVYRVPVSLFEFVTCYDLADFQDEYYLYIIEGHWGGL